MPSIKTYHNRFFEFLGLTKQYFRFLAGQGVTLPSFGTLLSWNNLMAYTQGLVPRNLAAYYPNDPNAIILDTSGNVNLWADASGNSATNALCLNAVVSNSASLASSAALQLTGSIQITVNAALDNWSALSSAFVSKRSGSSGEYLLRTDTTTAGRLNFVWFVGGVASQTTSTVSVPFANFASGWVRVTKSASSGGNVTVRFYTSTDGVTFTQLGTDGVVVSADATATGNSVFLGAQDATTSIMAGRLYSVKIENSFDAPGTVACNVNFATQTKLATSFLESSSNAATVTINTSGDTGARICGERDLYQGTAANRPAYTGPSTTNRLSVTFDGTNDYLKSAAFVLVQPETVYFVGSQITYTAFDRFYSGGSAAIALTTQQGASSGDVSINSGSTVGILTNVPLGVKLILAAIFNSASSLNRLNRTATVAGSAGTNEANVFTLAARNDSLGNYGNITVNEVAIYSEAHNDAVQTQVINYFSVKHSIPL